MPDGTIFNIQKFCVNDGPGIRTTVFLKGCPLNCLWCHNPESKSTATELFYDPAKCIQCHRCAAQCATNSHIFQKEEHLLERTTCVACGNCARVCPAGAVEAVGYRISPEDALAHVLTDKIFYDNSGGGLTVSGGEPMYQFEFTHALLKLAKEAGLHTCMETCGFARSDHFRQIAEYVDVFLFDCKETDPDKHRQYTGVSNELILKNLFLLDELGASLILRCPIIPGCNDRWDHYSGIASLANQLRNVQAIELEPYHPLGKSKAEHLGKDYSLGDISFPEESVVQTWIDAVSSQTGVSVRRG